MSDNLRHAKAYEKLLSEKENLECRLAEAEEEIKSLRVQRRIDSDHRAMYCQMKNEAESRLRAASDVVKVFPEPYRREESTVSYGIGDIRVWRKRLEAALASQRR